MAEPTTDRPTLVASTANRLRLIQADFADENADVRDDYVADEVKRALSRLMPGERPLFLDELAAEFPAWDERVEASAASQGTGGAGAAGRSAFDERELQDPAFLVERLAELAPTLSEGERRAAIERLAAAGLMAAGAPEWPMEVAQSVRAKLTMEKGDPIDAARALELILFLGDFAMSLDQLVWSTWKTISPKSMVRRQAPLQRILGRFLKGDQDVPRGQVSQELDKLRQLTASLISSVSQVGRQFAQRHLAKLSPAEIENWAKMEKGGFMTGSEVKCWRKYVELTKTLDESVIETEIFQSIAEYTESLIKGIGH